MIIIEKKEKEKTTNKKEVTCCGASLCEHSFQATESISMKPSEFAKYTSHTSIHSDDVTPYTDLLENVQNV